MTKDNTISYKELYELIDERFTRFEEKLDDRIGQLHDRVDKVHIRISENHKEIDLRLRPLENLTQKIWVYLTLGIAIIAIAIELGLAWLRRTLHI